MPLSAEPTYLLTQINNFYKIIVKIVIIHQNRRLQLDHPSWETLLGGLWSSLLKTHCKQEQTRELFQKTILP